MKRALALAPRGCALALALTACSRPASPPATPTPTPAPPLTPVAIPLIPSGTWRLTLVAGQMRGLAEGAVDGWW